jgi:hypothetical protein
MQYAPEPPPANATSEELTEWTYRQLLYLGGLLEENTNEVFRMEEANVVPARLFEGLLVHADGTNFDPGDGAGFYSYHDGAYHYLEHVGGAAGASGGMTQGFLIEHEDLRVTTVGIGTDMINFTALRLTLINDSNDPLVLTDWDLTLDINTVGLLGRDGGSTAGNTWWHLYAIAKDDGTKSAVLSPEWPGTGEEPAWPADYTYRGYIGAAYYFGGFDFRQVIQRNNVAASEYNSWLINVSSDSAWTQEINVDLVPPTATKMSGFLIVNDFGEANATAYLAASDEPGDAGFGLGTLEFRAANANGDLSFPFELLLGSPQSFFYQTADSNTIDVYITGYTI